MLVITVAFTAFNVAIGMLLVAQPWLAHERLPGGAIMLGALGGVLACAELDRLDIAGAIRPAVRPMLRIGLLQFVAGAGLLLLLQADPITVMMGEVVCGVPAALLVVSSQAVRYARTPEALRGRTMTLMWTLMLSALPVGSVIGGPLLAADDYTVMVLVMALLAAVPGILSLSLRNAVINRRMPEVVSDPATEGAGRMPDLTDRRVRAAVEFDFARAREYAGLHEYDGRIQDLSPAGVADALAGLGLGAPPADPFDAALLNAHEDGLRVRFAEAEEHRSNPLLHAAAMDLACYDREYAPLGERRRARERQLGLWPEAVDNAVASLDRVSAPHGPPRPGCDPRPGGRGR